MISSYIIPFIGGALTVLVGIWLYKLIIHRRNENRFKDDLDV